MKFGKFYPYARPTSLSSRAKLSLQENLFDRKFFSERTEIDSLFLRLEEAEENEKILQEEGGELIEICDGIILRQALAKSAISKLIIIAVFSAKMEIYVRLQREDKIKKEFDNFARAGMLAKEEFKSLLDQERSYFSLEERTVKDFIGELVFKLNPTIIFKDDADLNDVLVPDILANASVVCIENYNSNKIRKIFHELWNIEALKPLLTVMVYATQGYYCNHNGEFSKGKKLRIIFNGNAIEGYHGSGHTSGLQFSGMIFSSLESKTDSGENVLLTSNRSAGTLAHEMHHAWERFYYNNGAKPYPFIQRSSPISADTDDSGIELLNMEDLRQRLMLKETKDLKKGKSIKVSRAVYESGVVLNALAPSDIFDSVLGYNESNFDAEIVVRVGQALAELIIDKKCNEEEAFAIIEESGLIECVKFFREEQQQMRETAQKLAEYSAITFSEEVGKTYETPPKYLVYESTDFHDAVRDSDKKRLMMLLEDSELDPFKKDNFGEAPLELAIETGNPPLVFKFLNSMKVLDRLGEDLPILIKLTSYLITLAKNEESEFSTEALENFKKIENLLGGKKHVWDIFHETRKIALDQDLIDSLKTKSPKDFVDEIERGEISCRDKFGNSFATYASRAGRDDLLKLVKEKYQTSSTSDKFLPYSPFRESLIENNPDQFLEALEELKKNNQQLPEKLGLDKKYDGPLQEAYWQCNYNFLESEKSSLAEEEEKHLQLSRKWFEVAKKLVSDFRLDPTKLDLESEEELKSPMELLPEEFYREMEEFIRACIQTTPGKEPFPASLPDSKEIGRLPNPNLQEVKETEKLSGEEHKNIDP